MIITIDGPAASGKGTLAKILADEKNYHYIDSGLVYRTIALIGIQRNVDETDEKAIGMIAKKLPINLENSTELRAQAVSSLSSKIAVIPAVRESVKEYIHKLAEQHINNDGGVVIDGRDAGTNLFPNADLKIFLTASPKVRAKRRFLELKGKGEDVTLEDIQSSMKERDERDRTRKIAPLIEPEGAVVIDTDHLSPEGILQKVLGYIEG